MVARKVAGACALALLLVTGACGGSADDEAALGTLEGDGPVRISSRERVAVELEPSAPIKLGKNTIAVSFPDDGAELVSVSALMPAHGHGSPAPVIERSGEGFVVRDLVLYMSGRWELRLGLRVGTREDEAIVAVDVP
jgi:hypothetical protein